MRAKLKLLANSARDRSSRGAPGNAFADALKKFPKTFDALFRNMIAAGEVGGILDTILNRLAQFMEKNEKLKREAEREALFDGVVKEASKLLEAEECALLVVDRQLDRLHARYKGDDGVSRDAYTLSSVTNSAARTRCTMRFQP